MNIPLPKSTVYLTRALAHSCTTLLFTLSVHCSAQANDYVGTLTDPDLWSIGANWSGGVPVNGQNVTIGAFVPPNGGPNVTFDFAYAGAGLNSLTLNPASFFIVTTLNQVDSGTVMIATTETIGTDFVATYNHHDGSNSAGTLIVGDLGGGTGTYNFTNGMLNGGAEFIGVSGIGTFNQSGGMNGVTGSLEIASNSGGTGTYNLTAGTVNAGTEVIGSSGTGTSNQTGGTNTVSGSLTIASNVGSVGTYNLSGGALSAAAEVIGNSGVGAFNQSGGTNLVSGSLTIASLVGSAGTYNLSGGTLTVNGTGILNNGTINLTGTGILAGIGGMTNNGTVNFDGGTMVLTGGVTNTSGAYINVTAATVFSGPVTNNLGGIVKLTGTNVSWTANFTNNGTYNTDPATSMFSDLAIGVTGVFVGGIGDVISVSGNLLNQSTQNITFDIDASLLVFDGAVSHQFTWPGADLGPDAAGYTDNFAVGIFELAAGASLDFVSGALYVSVLDLDGGLAQADSVTGGGRIYYDPAAPENAYLAGGTYGGGIIAPVPEPTAFAQIASAGALLAGGLRRRGVRRAA